MVGKELSRFWKRVKQFLVVGKELILSFLICLCVEMERTTGVGSTSPCYSCDHRLDSSNVRLTASLCNVKL